MDYGLVRLAASSGLLVAAAGSALSGAVPAVTLVVAEGDAMDGSVVSLVNAPHTNGLGEVGLVIGLDDGRRAIWLGNGPIFFTDDALPDVLTGGESTMGVGDNGEFIFSPSFNGDDAVYGNDGLILVENTAAPDAPDGFNTTFHSRPRMINDGSAYWASGLNDGAGGTSTVDDIVYFRDAATGTITGILRTGDVVDGVTVGSIDFDMAFSDDGSHSVFVFENTFTGDNNVAVDGMIIAREGAATGGGDNWDNFDVVDINNAGDSVFSGDTDGATTVDEFIAYNGVIQLRESDTLASGLTLDGSVNALSINDNGEAVFSWSYDDDSGDVESIFYASDASDMHGTAVVLLSVGDMIDVTGDGLADLIVTDFNASSVIGPGLDLAEDGRVYFEVDVEDNDFVEFEAIIGIDLPGGGGCNPADLAEPFGVLNLDDVNAFVTGFTSMDPIADLDGNSIFDLGDVQGFVMSFNAGCP